VIMDSLRLRWSASAFRLLLLLYVGIQFMHAGGADPFVLKNGIGINYGRVADNLPAPSKAVELMKSINAGYVKIYDADSQVLRALSNSSLPVVITVKNEQVAGISSSIASSDKWVETNVVPYYPLTKICVIMVGNEILSDTQIKDVWPQLVPAMENIHSSLAKKKLESSIKVTTSVAMDAFASSYPPSNGSFRADIASSVMQPMLRFLNTTDSYFFLDVYPFFAWNSDPANISLEYALFGQATEDGYSNMLDAQLDAALAAMAALGYGQVRIAISETGWPTKGDSSGATVANAARYNTRLAAKLLSNAGTPRRPNTFIPTFIFSLFNENNKPGAATERNWGIFNPNGTPLYAIDLAAAKTNYTQGVSKSSNPQWCVAIQEASNDSALQGALDYACGAGADCSAIQPGGTCYQPDTLSSHASYAMNSFWQKAKSSGATCNFNATATLTTSDP
ncbi:hypothetical protein KI387_016982, partial [Taxus chinensis]